MESYRDEIIYRDIVIHIYLAEHEQIILPETLQLLLSTVTSSLNTREPVSVAAVHAHTITLPPSCFTDEVASGDKHMVPAQVNTGFF